MGMLYHAVFTFMICLLSAGTGGGANIVLTQSPVEVKENSSVTLSCFSTSDQILTRMYWILFEKIYGVSLTDNPCRAITYPLNRTDRYTLNCSDIHNISLTIRQVDRLQHGDTWGCRVGQLTSTYVTIYVTVPVETLEILDIATGYTEENKTSHIRCSSSFSRPKSDIYWFYFNNGSSALHDDERIISNITESIVNKTIGNKTNNILTSTESLLELKVHRSMNNHHIYCLTNDSSGRSFRSSLKILNISYPPDGPPYIRGLGNNGTYKVINEYQGNISCIVTGGNPLPNLNWTCLQTGNQTIWRSNTTVTSYFTWTASIDNDKMKCSCQSQYLGGQSSAFVSLDVLYPPSLPEFYIQSKNGDWHMVSSEINIKENNSLTIKCSSESNPVSMFSWTGPESSYNETLKMNEANNRTEGTYICIATNVMTQTNGASLEGKKNNSIRVNVLYPPSDIAFIIRNLSAEIAVSEIVNMTEKKSYILECHGRGKPEPKFSWTGPVSLTSDVLNLTNINRNKAGNYTCEAKNTINESTGDIYIGRENKTIHLNIQYASEVTEFSIAGHKEGDTVITNQGENATFLCNVDSNPNSSIGLQFNDTHFVIKNNTRNLTHFIRNLPCSSAGIYSCFSSNEINNGKRSWKQFTLIVRCPPLPEKDLNYHVTTLKYVSATLRFKAMDYLDSNNTTFSWQRENNASQWLTVKHDTKGVKVSTYNLQTNLTVVNVTGHYSGNYRVVYNNSVGGNTQMFQLSVADLPDKPTSFDYLKDSLTSTQVTIVWTKGYGGGLRQTFVINISQRSQPIKYDYINETENEHMQHTITGLSSGTQYKLTLWATNMLGKSLSQTLTIFTKDDDVLSNSNLTATIAGSVSSLVAILAGVIIGFLLYRRR